MFQKMKEAKDNEIASIKQIKRDLEQRLATILGPGEIGELLPTYSL